MPTPRPYTCVSALLHPDSLKCHSRLRKEEANHEISAATRKICWLNPGWAQQKSESLEIRVATREDLLDDCTQSVTDSNLTKYSSLVTDFKLD